MRRTGRTGKTFQFSEDPLWQQSPQPHPFSQIVFYHCDQIGTPQEMTDEHGEIAWQAQYKAWGEAKVVVEKIRNPLRFQGQYFDHETGLHYNRFRYYDPEIGRYLSKDPIGFAGGLNLHAYVANPTQWVDPRGLYAEVTVSGNTVVIILPIEYTGPGATPDVISKFNTGIRNQWTGRFGKYTVVTRVITPVAGCVGTKKNTINVPTGDGRAFVNRVGGNTGRWQADRPAWTAAHEAGHLMGLPDQYNYSTGLPNNGYGGNIMAVHGGRPNEADIDAIIRANP
jgi:RHS repeat-associated protein